MKEKIQQVLNAIAKNILYLKFYNLFGNSVKPRPLAVSLETPNHQDLIDINTIDIKNLKTIDDVLDYVNKVGKERFDNESIEKLKERIEDRPFIVKRYEWFEQEYWDEHERMDAICEYISDDKFTANPYMYELSNWLSDYSVKYHNINLIHDLIARTNFNTVLSKN